MMFTVLLAISPAKAQDAFSFAVVGDTQTDGTADSINWDVLPAVVAGAEAQGASYLLVAGDLVGGSGSLAATIGQWEDFRAVTADFSGSVLVVPGNHDVYGGAGTFDAWRETFPELPQDDSPEGEEGVSYYIDHGDTRLIFVTSDRPARSGAVSSEGLGWLGRVLSESSDLAHVFVTTHHPVSFSADSSHGGTAGDFWQLLVAHSVDSLFVGHWHRYQPGQLGAGGDTWETILGTGGGWQGYAPSRPYQQVPGFVLVEVDGPEATATFFSDADGDGELDDPLDAFVVASASPPTRGLKARYRFDDGTAQDDAPDGRAVHGVLEAGARVSDAADGPAGRWLDLSGSADFVEAGAIGDYVLAVHGALTLSAFARIDAAPADPTWGSPLLCYATNDYSTEDEQSNYAWWLSVLPDGALVGFWEHGDGNNVSVRSTAPSALVDGDWHHVAMVRDDDEQVVRFFIDGALLGEPVAYDTAPTGGARGMLYIGADTRANAGTGNLVGAVDEVCVFDVALELTQIKALAALEDCAAGNDDTSTDTGDSGSADTGEPGTDPPEGRGDDTAEADGCGCASGSRSGGWLVGLWLVVGLRRRAIRASARRPGSRRGP